MSNANPSVTDIRANIDRLLSRPVLVCVLIGTISVVQMLRGGSTTNLLILLLGAILSAVGMFSFSLGISLYTIPKKKSVLALLIAFLGSIPWFFGSYLVFYKGLWGLTYLFDNFSIWGLMKSLLFIAAGYTIVNRFHQITQIERNIAEGRITISP